MDFAAEEEEGGEEEAEEEGAGKVGVVHYVLGDGAEGVQDCEGLLECWSANGCLPSNTPSWRGPSPL